MQVVRFNVAESVEACLSCLCTCLPAQISKSYTTTEWREDLKRITRHAGGAGQPCVFLFSDTQVAGDPTVCPCSYLAI
jgi:dynein heavy chain